MPDSTIGNDLATLPTQHVDPCKKPTEPQPSSSSSTRTRRPRGMSQSLHSYIDHNRPSILHSETTDDNLFDRLQEQNARLPPQESTTFILAQIERQNNLLEKDPKALSLQSDHVVGDETTVQQLVTDNVTAKPSTTPPMTPTRCRVSSEDDIDWDFWEAVIQDFDRVAIRMPHLLSVKLRGGVPTPLRGLIWQAMCKSGSLHLETVYGQLCNEQSPYERVIQRDLTRTFPCIDMFKQEGGEGQLAMRRILEAYSLYDPDVGYCQGLAFVVGPLLMHMPEIQAFCVFVRLMETYEMRPMFTHKMEGLQLRLYQFSCLLKEHLPDLAAHMEAHGVHAAMYASQWFLTLFAYGFPLPLVERIYDIVFAEGAAETIMRVAIAMLRRAEPRILQETEFEDLLDHVTSHRLCDSYDNHADVIEDATALSSTITRDKMDELAEQYQLNGVDDDNNVVLPQSSSGTNNGNNGRFSFFWRRSKKPPVANKKQEQLRRSASSSNSIKKRWSTAVTSPPSSTSPDSIGGRASFSSVRSFSSSSFMMVDPSPPSSLTSSGSTSSKYVTLEQHEEEVQRLSWTLAQLNTKYQQTIDELVELKMDKQDVESERDALKITVRALEKTIRQGNGGRLSTTASNRRRSSSSPEHGNNELHKELEEDDSDSMHSISSPDGCFSDATSQSVATTMASCSHEHDGNNNNNSGVELRSELVRIKVENFELQQQCEKLTQEVEDVQSKLDMVNEGQMALVDKMITTKADMDEVLKEKKAKDLEWVEATQENNALKKELAHVKQQLAQAQMQENDATCAKLHRIHQLERALAEAKLQLVEYETGMMEYKRRTTIDYAPSDIKNRTGVDMRRASMQHPPSSSSSMTRSSSIYGRMWHAITPRPSTTIETDCLSSDQ
ncbi:hypothetical protein K492DRAFT_203534 [Lichtheimia hyalospora FSU 10163]|nr:hypothetical protein K492DRAFT_203534 [Lichtheimia hyalospora FSU 10163]